MQIVSTFVTNFSGGYAFYVWTFSVHLALHLFLLAGSCLVHESKLLLQLQQCTLFILLVLLALTHPME